jgi:aspartate kinase
MRDLTPPSDTHAAPAAQTDTVVMKFGGSSVADPDKIRHVARRLVEARERGARVVGTVSAMGHTTDTLLELAASVSPNPHPRELDMLLSTGERIACALVAMAIHDLGHEAVSFTGSQAGIITDPVHTKAKIREITPVRVLDALDRGKIVLVAGFQGFSRDTMDVTTLGRGGTDATAVALAAALGASCEIYSDVPGVFTADPRIVPDARKLPEISYEEMLEMAASGAKVLMLRAVELARGHSVPVHARSTFSDEEGTWVRDTAGMEQPIVSAVTHAEDEVLFHLRGVPDRPGAAATIFDAVAAEHVNVDTILQNVVGNAAEVSFSVPEDDVRATRRALERAQETLGAFETEEISDLGKVSIVGAGMRSHPGVAARMFRTLADEGINIRLISTSPIKISCLISRAAVPAAVRALHAAFDLGATDTHRAGDSE